METRLRTPNGDSAMDDANDAVRVNIVAGSSGLPTGAATAANQTTGNASLSSIDGKITACNTGAVVIASGTITSITNAVTVSALNLDIRDLSSVSDSVSAVQSGTWDIGTVTTLTGITNPVAVTGTFWQATQPVSLASVPSHAVTNAGTFAVQITDMNAGEYETVAASQTDQVLGATGGAGDWLSGVLIVPATTSPGAVSIKDGAGSAITIFTGGASSVSNLVPFFVPLGIKSASGAWKVTTGTNVSCIGVGNFT